VGTFRRAEGFWRAGLMALAVMALFVRILVPNGFMMAEGRASGGFPLVICTGHGPLTLPGSSKSPPMKSHDGGACAFAGHASAPPPTLASVPASVPTAYAAPPLQRAVKPAPGLGLAAPPPPSHAPPLQA
jgi:hypothetical protein